MDFMFALNIALCFVCQLWIDFVVALIQRVFYFPCRFYLEKPVVCCSFSCGIGCLVCDDVILEVYSLLCFFLHPSERETVSAGGKLPVVYNLA